METVTPTPAAVISLLTRNQLPVDDINALAFDDFLAIGSADAPDGVIGLERLAPTIGLLRSLAVSDSQRGLGLGSTLTDALEQHAKDTGIEALYLLTETATPFFAKRGYQVVSRERLPQPVLESRECQDLCPASADVMCKSLLG